MGTRAASHQEAGSSQPRPFPSNVDWRELVPKRIVMGLSAVKRMKRKFQELGQEDAYPVYEQDEISSIPDLYNVPLSCRLRCAPNDSRAYKEQQKFFVVYLSGLIWGMVLPLHSFMVELLDFYRLSPCQVVPKSWWVVRLFLIVCSRGELVPSLKIFHCFFTLWESGDWWLFLAARIVKFLVSRQTMIRAGGMNFSLSKTLRKNFPTSGRPRLGHPCGPCPSRKPSLRRTWSGLRPSKPLYISSRVFLTYLRESPSRDPVSESPVSHNFQVLLLV